MFGGDVGSDVVPRQSVKNFVDDFVFVVPAPNARHANASTVFAVRTGRQQEDG